MDEIIGLLHPGEMGAAVGAELVRAGRRVLWASEGRSGATAERAAAAGLEDAGTVAALVADAVAVLSICPPHAAEAVAAAAAGFGGPYVDANAVAPSTARRVAAAIEAGGGSYVDGGIVGPPPAPGRPTHLWLSGTGAAAVAARFAGTAVRARVAGGDAFAASMIKMSFAAWTKGSFALLLAVRAAARAGGVEAELLDEWRDASPGLAEDSRRAARQAAAKGWRWVGEMDQIAETFRALGLPGGFHEAAAAVYARPERRASATVSDETLEAVLAGLLRDGRVEPGDGSPAVPGSPGSPGASS